MGPLGFGGGALGNLYREISDEQAGETVGAALSSGIRYFDTAPHYGFGLSERRLGTSLREAGPNVPLVLSSKVGRMLIPAPRADLGAARQGFISPEPFESAFDYGYDAILRSFDESLRRLGRPIDILYAHDLGSRTHADQHPSQFRHFMNDGLRAMLWLREQGGVRAIGLGVNEWQVCEEVLAHTDLDVVLLAGRYTLLEQDSVETFLPLCERRGVAVVVGGPFNSGILASGETAQGPTNYDYQAAPPAVLARVAALQAVCDRHRVPLAAAALQFPLAHPAVASVIPGIGSVGECRDAVRWIGTSIPAAFWAELRDLRLLRADAPVPVQP